MQQLKNIRTPCKSLHNINNTKTVIIDEENAHFKFQNFKKLQKAPFLIYPDFENIFPPETDISYTIHILHYIKIMLLSVMTN